MKLAAPLAWTVAALFVMVACAAVVGGAAYGSESAGVTATDLLSFPFGFALGAAPGAWIIHFASQHRIARAAVPAGCGCVSSLGVGMITFLIMASIFR